MAFGSLLVRELPSLTWVVKIDEWGCSLALDLENSGLTVFPKDMILKRFDEKENVVLEQLAEDTIHVLEELFRKHHIGEPE